MEKRHKGKGEDKVAPPSRKRMVLTWKDAEKVVQLAGGIREAMLKVVGDPNQHGDDEAEDESEAERRGEAKQDSPATCDATSIDHDPQREGETTDELGLLSMPDELICEVLMNVGGYHDLWNAALTCPRMMRCAWTVSPRRAVTAAWVSSWFPDAQSRPPPSKPSEILSQTMAEDCVNMGVPEAVSWVMERCGGKGTHARSLWFAIAKSGSTDHIAAAAREGLSPVSISEATKRSLMLLAAKDDKCDSEKFDLLFQLMVVSHTSAPQPLTMEVWLTMHLNFLCEKCSHPEKRRIVRDYMLTVGARGYRGTGSNDTPERSDDALLPTQEGEGKEGGDPMDESD